MAWHLFGAKPLSKPMMAYYQLDPCWEMKFESKYNNFHTKKLFWKYHLQKGDHFVSALMCKHNIFMTFTSGCVSLLKYKFIICTLWFIQSPLILTNAHIYVRIHEKSNNSTTHANTHGTASGSL